MTEPLYVSRATLTTVADLHRRARIVTGVTLDLGVHGPIKELFRLSPPRELPLPVDHVVAAVGGCMLGTLVGALEVRQVKLAPGVLNAEVEGHHEMRGGLPVLASVRVRYRMKIPAGTREAVDRALARHQEKCPTAATLAGAVAVSWTAEIEEAGAVA